MLRSATMQVARRLLGACCLVHPFPVLMNAVPATAFMYMASPEVHGGRLVTFAFAVVATHGSFGALNDFCDFELDRAAKPSKPLVRGLVSRSFALALAVVLGVVGLILSQSLNWATFGFGLAVLIAGVWYDLGAKGTILSWVPYAIFIPSGPLWGFAAAGRFEPFLLLAYPLGALVALGLNVSNTLPDLAEDVHHGIRGLPHMMGVERGLRLSWASFAAAMIGFAAASPLLGNDWRILAPGLGVGVLLLVAMIVDYAMFASRSLKRTWYASAFLAVLVGFAWVASLPRVTR
ncbi:MAG: UbiA family prenyltransferase [Candidatus Rokubacteria bacterium]|nr:UbiA family prenyltransferase [Candidatus Rokubacteria bacterium]